MAKGRRPTTRCSGVREAQFTSSLVRPFAHPLNAGVRLLRRQSEVEMQSVKKLINILRAKKKPRIIQVKVVDDGFRATGDDATTKEAKWSDIERIYAYKVDCFAYDVIWLAFERAGREELHIPEDAQGFNCLMEAIRKVMPSITAGWYCDVAQPPFAENLTLLFKRRDEA